MRSRRTWLPAAMVVAAFCLLAGLAGPVSAEEKHEERKAQTPEPPRQEDRIVEEATASRPSEALPVVRLMVTVYQVELAADQTLMLDAAHLATQASTPAALATALQKLGETRVLYRVDQVVPCRPLGGRSPAVELDEDAPYTTGSKTDEEGHKTISVNRTKVGLKVDFGGSFPDPADRQRVHATLGLRLTGFTRSQVKVVDEASSPIFWSAEQRHAGDLRFGHPTVLLSTLGGALAAEDRVVALVTLVQLGEPPAPK